MAVSKDFAFNGNKDLRYLDAWFEEKMNQRINKMFPVGSIVTTESSVTPSQMGYIGTWEQIGGGYVLASRRNDATPPFNGQSGSTPGSADTNHTHTIYNTEEWPHHETIPSTDRVIYADLIDANNEAVDQAKSQERSVAAGYGDSPVQRLVLHSDRSNAEYWRNVDPTGESHTYTDLDFGTLELRPTWPRTFLRNDEHPEGFETPGYNNPITASYAGEGEHGLSDNYPPCWLVNVWRRKS